MRRLMIVILFLAIGYSGYWFFGATAAENGAINALRDLEKAGWDVTYDDLSTRGFPSRFDTTVTELSLTRPDGQLTYTAPFLQAFALSYRPNRVIAAFPNTQNIRIGANTLTVESEALKMSGSVAANTALSFEAATATADWLRVVADTGTRIRSGPALLAVRTNGAPMTYDVFAQLETVTLPNDLWQRMFPNETLPLDIGEITISAKMTVDQQINRMTLTQPQPPLITALDLRNVALSWGQLQISAQGALTIDSAGIPTGSVTIIAVAWDALITGLANIGTIDPAQAQLLTNISRSMAAGGDTLDIPITLRNGMMFIGPIPIGPAPRFR